METGVQNKTHLGATCLHLPLKTCLCEPLTAKVKGHPKYTMHDAFTLVMTMSCPQVQTENRVLTQMSKLQSGSGNQIQKQELDGRFFTISVTQIFINTNVVIESLRKNVRPFVTSFMEYQLMWV